MTRKKLRRGFTPRLFVYGHVLIARKGSGWKTILPDGDGFSYVPSFLRAVRDAKRADARIRDYTL